VRRTVALPLLVLWIAAGCRHRAGSDAAPPTDSGTDAAGTDAGTDAGAPDSGDDCLLGDAGTERTLAESGYFSDPCARVVDPALVEFAPQYVLWSDGATKRRWIKLPPGGIIDTSDMDHWVFPIGTQFFKEFTRDGVRVETRLIERTGPGAFDYWMGSFVWLPDQTEAIFAPDGAVDVNGTPHNVPAANQCWACHIGDAGRILGFSAVQLSKPGPGVNLDWLISEGLLSDPPPLGSDFAAPGTPDEVAALGYLHANCGHCHNPLGGAWPYTDQILRLNVADRIADQTTTWTTTVDVPLVWFMEPPFAFRIVSGDPTMSAIIWRMSNRGNPDQMPPLATEITDPTGIATVSTWITGLP